MGVKGFFESERELIDIVLRMLGVRCCHTCRYFNPKEGCENEKKWNYSKPPHNKPRKRLKITQEYRRMLGRRCQSWE